MKEEKKQTVKGLKTEKKAIKYRRWFYYLSKFLFGIVGLFYPTKIINKGNIKAKGNYIYACNHLTNIDIPFTQIRMKGVRRYIGKREFIDTKAYGALARHGVIFMDREIPEMATLRQVYSVLEEKNGQVFIFPEGTRNRGDHTKMLPIRHGLSIIAGKTGTPVIPVALYRPCKTFKMNYLYFGEPIYPPECNGRMPRSNVLRAMTEQYAYEMQKAWYILHDHITNKRWKKKNRLAYGAVPPIVAEWEERYVEEKRQAIEKVQEENKSIEKQV